MIKLSLNSETVTESIDVPKEADCILIVNKNYKTARKLQAVITSQSGETQIQPLLGKYICTLYDVEPLSTIHFQYYGNGPIEIEVYCI